MKNPALFLEIRQHIFPKKDNFRQSSCETHSGFTLIEVIVVVLMIAILAAIAAPSWLGFVNNQRVGKVNDAILSAIQEAQREAKSKKLTYNVSFKTDPDDKSLKVAVYTVDPTTLTTPTTLPWQSLGKDLNIQEGQVLLCSNIDTATPNKAAAPNCDLNGDSQKRTITFDYQGNLPREAVLSANGFDGLAITAAVPNSSDPTQPLEGAVRCVKVTTLLGSLQTGRGKYDATNNKQGCPLP